jgi:hypothetical protein
LQFPTSMRANKNILVFTGPALPQGRHRMRAQPAHVIPLRAYRRGHERFNTTALFAVAAILVWAGAIFVALADFRFNNHAWVNDLFPGWQGWPLW